MADSKVRFIDILFPLAIIGADIFVYIILGVLQMGYDDHWDISKGEYGSLKSMSRIQIVFYLALQLWNLINIIGIIFLGRNIFKRLSRSK